MDLCDNNVWLALALSHHVQHTAARRWLDSVREPGSVFFCRTTQQGFLRLMTNTAVLTPYGNRPLTNNQAWSAYGAFLDDYRIALWPDEPAGLGQLWRSLSARDSASPKLWMDAYLAAFAMAAGCRLVTNDAAFRQFRAIDLLVI
ncbi:MAG: PIN domain-containing protein [Chloroflexi bacterium]|nr:PIN domain-containing protein [Chloroflexota bacterium]